MRIRNLGERPFMPFSINKRTREVRISQKLLCYRKVASLIIKVPCSAVPQNVRALVWEPRQFKSTIVMELDLPVLKKFAIIVLEHQPFYPIFIDLLQGHKTFGKHGLLAVTDTKQRLPPSRKRRSFQLSDPRRRVSSQNIEIGLIGVPTSALLAADLLDDPELLEMLKSPLYRGLR